MDNEKQVILVELYGWHSECLYSQVLYLNKSGYKTTLICDIRHKDNIVDIKPLVDSYSFFDFKKLWSLWSLRRIINKHKSNKVIFNTAQGSILLKLMLMPFSPRVKFYGTLHNIRKLQSSFGQALISRKITRYFILADYIKKNFSETNKYFKNGLKCQSITVAFTPSQNVEPKTYFPQKGENDIWITVPGSIEYKRRDYYMLAALVSDSEFPLNTKILLLGNAKKADGPEYIAKLKKYDIYDRFIVFDSFVPNDIFNYCLSKSDYLLPLVQPSIDDAGEYSKFKISGTFIISEGREIPMLCHRMFREVDGFNYKTIFYENSINLLRLINAPHLSLDIDPAPLNFEEERERYISFLENN